MWFKESNGYFCKIENFAYGEINEQSFSNPHHRWYHDHKEDIDIFVLEVLTPRLIQVQIFIQYLWDSAQPFE